MKSLSARVDSRSKNIVVSETGDERRPDGPSCLHAHFLKLLTKHAKF